MRLIGSIVPLVGLIAASPFAAADSDLASELDQRLQSYICTETFSSCSNIDAESCAALVAKSTLSCPAQQLVALADKAIGDDSAEEQLHENAREYSICVLDEFRLLASAMGVSEDCVNTAVGESIAAEKERLRIEWENMNKDGSR